MTFQSIFFTTTASAILEDMSLHEQLEAWALELGVKLHGVSAQEIPGRGIGMVAERNLQVSERVYKSQYLRTGHVPSQNTDCVVRSILMSCQDGELLLEIPTAALMTAQSVSQTVKDAGIKSVNGLLAAEIALDEFVALKPWRRSLLEIESYRKSLPIMWPRTLQKLLPRASRVLVEKQRARFQPDWIAVSASLPNVTYEQYLYCWLVVSTRTFYWTSSDPDVEAPADPYDCLAIVPFADYFNHANRGCQVKFSASGFEIYAHQQIEKGEEIFTSYGNHNNDFLFAEYGFMLAENQHDTVCLDEVLLPLFSGQVEEDVRAADFLGDFLLDRNGVCYRTQVALRRLCMPRSEWQKLLTEGIEEPDDHLAAVNSLLTESLKRYLRTAQLYKQDVENLDCGQNDQIALLRRRWEQMQCLLSAGVHRYANSPH